MLLLLRFQNLLSFKLIKINLNIFYIILFFKILLIVLINNSYFTWLFQKHLFLLINISENSDISKWALFLGIVTTYENT